MALTKQKVVPERTSYNENYKEDNSSDKNFLLKLCRNCADYASKI